MADTPLYGLMAEFPSTDALVSAAERVHQEGYTRIDALTPMPVHGLAEAMGYDDRRIQKMILAGGLFGCAAGLGLQLHVNLIGWNILFASLTAVIGTLALCGFPQPYHPVFNVKRFRERGSTDGLFLCVEAEDPKFNAARTRDLLQGLGARGVYDIDS